MRYICKPQPYSPNRVCAGLSPVEHGARTMLLKFGPSVFSRLKLTAPPLWLVVVLPLAYFTAAHISLSYFGANTPLWMSNAFVVTALLRNKRSTWPVLLCLGALADYSALLTVNGRLVSLGIMVCDSTEISL